MIQQENRFTCQGQEKVCSKHYLYLCKGRWNKFNRKIKYGAILETAARNSCSSFYEGAGLRRGRDWEGYSATTFLLDLIFQGYRLHG